MQAPSRLKDGKGGRAAEAAADSREQRVSKPACGPSELGGGKAARVSLNPLKAVGRVYAAGAKRSVEIPGGTVEGGQGSEPRVFLSPLHAHILVHWAPFLHNQTQLLGLV